MDRKTVFDYIKKKYKVFPEYPWRRYDENAVFRHTDNKKWFALVMDVQREKLGMSGKDYIDVVNLKIDDMFFRDMIIREDGILPAYHMNKLHWSSIILDGSVDEDVIEKMVRDSYDLTAPKRAKQYADEF